MQRTNFGELACSIARTLDVIGEPWSPLILRDVWVGFTRFEQLQAELGISRKVLTERLNHLVERGRARAPAYDQRPRYEYVLTDKGTELVDVLMVMSRWGDRWLAGKAGPPVLYRHHACGEISRVDLRCAHCGEPMHAGDVDLLPGPGAVPFPFPVPGPRRDPVPRVIGGPGGHTRLGTWQGGQGPRDREGGMNVTVADWAALLGIVVLLFAVDLAGGDPAPAPLGLARGRPVVRALRGLRRGLRAGPGGPGGLGLRRPVLRGLHRGEQPVGRQPVRLRRSSCPLSRFPASTSSGC